MLNEKIFDYKSFFENIPNIFCITDLDLQIIDANKAFLNLFEATTLADLPTDFKLLLEKDTFQINNFSVSNQLEKNQFSSYLASDFKPNLVEWQFTVDSVHNGIYISGIVTKEQNTLALRPKKREGKIGGWEYFIETNELWWSEEVYDIHEEELNKPIEVVTAINYYFKDDIPIISELFRNALENGIPYDEELRIVTTKGNIKWVRGTGKRVLKNGKPYKVHGNFLDIHRQKIAELELKRNKILLQKILDSLPVGVFWKDKKGVYSGINQNCASFLSLNVSELLGKKDEDLIEDAALLNKVKAQDEAILLHKKSHFERRTVKIPHKQNRTVDIEKLPLLNEDGEVFGILGVFIDTTQLTNVVNSLKRKNNELRELLFAVSHDLKEPLKGINRFAQLLKKRYDDELGIEGSLILEYILKETHRQYLQFRGLTRFLEVGNKEQELSLVSLNDVIYEVIHNLGHEDKSIPNFEISLDNVPKLNYYKYDLMIVFQELIKNAIKFRRANQDLKIKISVKEEKNLWKITISDNGEGFDMQLKDKVFVIFQKLHTKNHYDGAGMGLPICKKIIEHYGGEIHVDTKPLEGVSINFTIPKVIVQNKNE